MNLLNFKIVTPERVVYQDQVESVTIPAREGEMTVMAHHTPLVSLLRAGELRVKKTDHEVMMAVSSGFIEIRPDNQLIILADTAERAEDIDEQKVEAARKRAQDVLKQKDTLSDEEHAAVIATVEREMARLNVAKKYRKLKGIRT